MTDNALRQNNIMSEEPVKSSHEVLGKPPVVQDLNDQYIRNPPHNEPSDPSQPRKPPGKKSGAYEDDPNQIPQEEVLGDEAGGRAKPFDEMRDVTNESSVHPHSSGDA
ncbi:hypothetical protein DH86_00000482 [Scytalidium sp. 3C]|nr:hypothetical protein DH86_00000482 [Scytalidium sp. 3C]